MKKLYFLILLSFSGIASLANHITGGEMYYTLTGQQNGNYTYHVTLKLYRDCFSTGAALDASAPISIFDNATNNSVWGNSVVRDSIVRLQIGTPNPCINNPPQVCYEVGYYSFTV